MSATPPGQPDNFRPTPAKRSLTESGLRPFFEACIKYEASDMLLRGGQVPKLRIRGSLKSLAVEPIPGPDFETWIAESLNSYQAQVFEQTGSWDMAVDLDNSHRFRINIFRTRGRAALAARRVSDKIFDFESLKLPPVMKQIAEHHQGLVLLAGVTGSGKSTTIASMLQYINETRACHILTIEDPIEYLFTDAKAMINQREVGIDTSSFGMGLRALVRENPDVVLIGELRDKETFEAALQAAEIGHLVFGTIHASSAAQSFQRIYDLFESHEHQSIRNNLAYQMQAFVYQKLLPTIREDLHRVPAVEVLLQSPPTRKYILEGKEVQLDEVIKQGREMGMRTFSDSLVELVNKQYIHPRTALAAANNPEEVKRMLSGVRT